MGKIFLARYYVVTKEYNQALKLLTEVIDLTKKRKTPGSGIYLGHALREMAKINLEKKKYKEALKDAKNAFRLLQSTQGNIMENSELLAAIYHRLSKNDSAYAYLKKYITIKDSILNRQFFLKLNNYKKQAEDEIKTSQINLLNKDNQLKESQLKQASVIKNALAIGFILLFLTGAFVFRNLRLKRKNEKLRRIQVENDMNLQQLQNEKKHAELQHRATELEMQALRAQMNPHFIFNCLTSINRFIFKNETKTASDYLTRFSRLIRMVLIHSQKKLITLEDELEMLRLYLEMERMRFKNNFDYSITFTNTLDAGAVFIPPLLLQPFCENAIWHGLMHKEGKGHLNIEMSEHDKTLHCIITDDGIGRKKAAELRSKSAEKEKSMGLKITTDRLALLNHEKNTDSFYWIEDILDDNKNVVGTKVELKVLYKNSVEEYV